MNSVGCAAYMAFEYHALRGLFDPRLGLAIARDYVGSTDSWQALIALLDDPASPWWDDPATPATETIERWSSARRSTRPPMTSGRRYGDTGRLDVGPAAHDHVRGGDAGRQRHPDRDLVPQRRAVPGRRRGRGHRQHVLELRGDLSRSVRRRRTRRAACAQVFDVTNGPSYRLDIDMGDLDGARIIITTGQSGNPFDRHYGDMIPAWLSGTQVPLPFSPAGRREGERLDPGADAIAARPRAGVAASALMVEWSQDRRRPRLGRRLCRSGCRSHRWRRGVDTVRPGLGDRSGARQRCD